MYEKMHQVFRECKYRIIWLDKIIELTNRIKIIISKNKIIFKLILIILN